MTRNIIYPGVIFPATPEKGRRAQRRPVITNRHERRKRMLLAAAVYAASLLAWAALAPAVVRGQALAPTPEASEASSYAPDLKPLLAPPPAELREVVARFAEDRATVQRRHRLAVGTAEQSERLRQFYAGWQRRLAELGFATLGSQGRIDYLLLESRLRREIETLFREQALRSQLAPLLPFAAAIDGLVVRLDRMERIDPRQAASVLAGLASDVERTRAAVEAGAKGETSPGAIRTSKGLALRAAHALGRSKSAMEEWSKFSAGYDPLFSWWTAQPYKKAEAALAAYQKTLREAVVGIKEGEDEPIFGTPIGRAALLQDLAFEMIPYTPEELIAIGEREFDWCEAEMLKATREMGLSEDWKAALDRVKNDHVEPGRQPKLIRELAQEAIRFLDERQLITIPALARDGWGMEMMSPERQKLNPFFTGGDVISVSFPTDGMSHEEKLMSLRGNNRHFARATVHHELIPGHHLQGFMSERYNPHRQTFSTPFWVEGWALYWEMALWDLGFPRTPEERIGMLFWRMHRAARIVFSLKFHLGQMTAQEAIDLLVDRVGHERANATGEVRRSFTTHYPPLYQAAYMIGGLQFRALHRELVGSGRLSDRAFHDAVLQMNEMPVEALRVLLTGQGVPQDLTARWKFAGDAVMPAGRAQAR